MMYGIYLVDDEKIIVDGLINTIAWLENGFEIIGHNTDPEKAIIEIIEKKPDVVFTDLKMPGCDGIELINRIKDSGAETEFILLSAYAEFEASRNFFLLGGIDYILKPLDHDSAGLVLEKVSRKLTSKNNQIPTVQFVPSQSITFDNLVSYVTENFNKKHTLNDLSQKFNLGATYICDLFSKHYGSTLKIFITNLRMKEALRLIIETDTPLKEVSVYCGYSDYQYFCKVFKAHFDKIPSDYREETE
jgi:YesN/AraC family two-component response regulator